MTTVGVLVCLSSPPRAALPNFYPLAALVGHVRVVGIAGLLLVQIHQHNVAWLSLGLLRLALWLLAVVCHALLLGWCSCCLLLRYGPCRCFRPCPFLRTCNDFEFVFDFLFLFAAERAIADDAWFT